MDVGNPVRDTMRSDYPKTLAGETLMAGPRRYDQETFERHMDALESRGVTDRHQQARELGIGYSTLMRYVQRASRQKYADLSAWIPWTIRPEHARGDDTARKLRRLAQAAEWQDTPYKYHRASALRWAKGLIDQGLDLTYDPDGGFVITTAPSNPEEWYLRRLVRAVERFLESVARYEV